VSEGKHIILASGGTGGHMVPAEALADELTARGHEVSLITDLRGDAYRNIMPNIDRMVLRATSHMRGGLFGKIGAGFSIIKSYFKVRKRYKALKPCLIVGFGGYPSMPAIMAARSKGVPYILHDQNAILGRVNRWTAEDAVAVALTEAETQRVPEGVKTVVTGNPVRTAIQNIAGQAYMAPEENGPIHLFILGGSQGAHILSKIVPSAISALPEELKNRLRIVHQARPDDIDTVAAKYKASGIVAEVKSYFDDVASILVKTHLVISRSGASTLAELKATGTPAILIPLAIAADGHQLANAKPLKESGAALIFEEHEFAPGQLTATLNSLLTDRTKMEAMAKAMGEHSELDAAKKLADLAEQAMNDNMEDAA